MKVTYFILLVIFSLNTLADQSEVQIGSHFNLMNHEGNIVSDTDFRDELMLVYFGFSNCRMICPASLTLISEVLNELDEEGKEKVVQPVFITIDPERDTVGRLNEYHESFHPDILMLTGDKEETKAAANAYKVYVDQEDYNKHSIFIYLMGKQGEYLAHFTYQSDKDDIIAKIKKFW